MRLKLIDPYNSWAERLGYDWLSVCSMHYVFDGACSMCRAGTWRSPWRRAYDHWWARTHWYDYQTNTWHKGKKPGMIEAWDRWQPDIDEHHREHPSPGADDD